MELSWELWSLFRTRKLSDMISINILFLVKTSHLFMHIYMYYYMYMLWVGGLYSRIKLLSLSLYHHYALNVTL